MTQSDDQSLELQIDLALTEYMQICDAGDVPDREQFLERHAELRGPLAELLSAADWIEQLAGPKLSEIALGRPDGEVAAAATNAQSAVGVAPLAADGPTRQSPLAISPKISADDETLPLHEDKIGPRPVMNFPGMVIGGGVIGGGVTGGGRSVEFSLDEHAAEPEISEPILPCRFGDYVLERVLGRGGMGVVYFGRQIQLDRPVAIKMIRSGALASMEEVSRFYAEARSVAKLDHPNIVTVYQCGECDGHRYFSMDYVAGCDLARLIQAQPLDCKLAARYVRDTARAIQYAHERGILHRDLKPANVLVDEQDQIHITDFGLAKSVGAESGLTASGAALGTPSYMSPEQAAGHVSQQHQATDVYSLGAVLFTIVTGEPPFKAAGVVQTIMHVIHRPAPRARTIRANVPADLETIIDVCLQKSPERRYKSAGALADDLNRFLNGTPIHARPASRWRRAWYWLLGIPIIGAVLDHRVIEPTDAHRWVQRGLISVAVLLAMMWGTVLFPLVDWVSNRMPKTVQVAGGAVGGNYDQLARAIADLMVERADCQAEVIPTGGSSDNAERLQRGEVHLALLQTDAVDLPALAVVAPLYYEAVHIFVKPQLKIESIADLRSHSVLLGAEKSGVRTVARLLLARAGLTFNDIVIDKANWQTLMEQPRADAAIVVTKPGAPGLDDLLRRGEYRLLPLADSWQFAMDEPIFHALLLDPQKYPNGGLPETGIATVATTAFLAARVDSPPILVQTVLRNLFTPEFVQQNGIMTAERAAHWPGQTWHPAAREFFQSYSGGYDADQ